MIRKKLFGSVRWDNRLVRGMGQLMVSRDVQTVFVKYSMPFDHHEEWTAACCFERTELGQSTKMELNAFDLCHPEIKAGKVSSRGKAKPGRKKQAR